MNAERIASIACDSNTAGDCKSYSYLKDTGICWGIPASVYRGV